jgi:hypothetical protein
MSSKNNFNNQSQDNSGHPLLNALSQFGRSFFLYLDPYPALIPSENPPDRVISIWERLQQCENEEGHSGKRQANTGGLLVRQIEPKEPIDFVEYRRRRN